MAVLGLNLPTDITWKRICVTNDMIQTEMCTDSRPPKWQSSMAIFKYLPEEDYQIYPGRTITYLKLAVTITGFQPLDQQSDQQIDWNGVSVEVKQDLENFLNSYQPCTGALIQLSVGPKEANVALDNYPYIMDVQPKKREMYEMATDTNERMSRSLESLNIRKAAGTTQSLEILDVDEGISVGATGGYSGVTGGGTYSDKGEWGTKRLNTGEGSTIRTGDDSRERRESFSHSTQLSQLYHLFDSYHVGTNRVVFFIQPRPHVLAEPSGIVDAPRPVDGFQEILLVVNQPKDQGEFCVEARLDTSHLFTGPSWDYDRNRTELTDLCEASVTVPDNPDSDYYKADPDHQLDTAPEETEDLFNPATGSKIGTAYYKCYQKSETKQISYSPPPDYSIDTSLGSQPYSSVVNENDHGTTSVAISPNGDSLTLTCTATSHACYFNHSDLLVSFADNEIDKWSSTVRQQLMVRLISKNPIISKEPQRMLTITSRGLCCCPKAAHKAASSGRIVGIVDLSQMQAASSLAVSQAVQGAASALKGARSAQPTQDSRALALDSMRKVNALSNTIRKTMWERSGSQTASQGVSFLDSHVLPDRLYSSLAGTRRGQALLAQPAQKALSEEMRRKLEKLFKGNLKTLAVRDIVTIPARDLASGLRLTEAQVNRLKLTLLGVPTREPSTAPLKRRKT